MEITEKRIPSSDGVHQLYCRVYYPEGEPVGLFHIMHGMTEHICRYDKFMNEMAEHGFICYGFDCLGHGQTAKETDDFGYLGECRFLIKDAQNVSRQMKAEYGKELPCYLAGHSMGSFIARCAASPKIWNKVILLGTGGPIPAVEFALPFIKTKIRIEGERAYSPAIENMVFSIFRKHFKDENDMIAWISTDKEVRDSFRGDPFCAFHFTLNGFYTLLRLLKLCNSKKWFTHVSSQLPMLLLSGSDDPLGGFGKDVSKVKDTLKANGKDARLKLYQGYRHELLNDHCHDEVVNDILAFINE